MPENGRPGRSPLGSADPADPADRTARPRRRRRLAHGLLLGLPALALLGLLAALLLALESTPRVLPRADLSHADVARAVAMVKAQDPRRFPDRSLRVLALGERDLDLLLNHAAHRFVGSAIAVRIGRGTARVQASVELPAGQWLNLQAEVADEAGRPVLRGLRAGHLPLPASLVGPAFTALARRHERGAEVLATLGMVQRVSFFPGRLSVVYAWDRDAGRRMLASLVSDDEQRRLEAYHRHLASLPLVREPGAEVPLGRLLPSLFALASERSAGGADAAAENRAALLTLTLHATRRSLAPLVPGARDWPYLPPQRVTLVGREDFALHFLISAVLAADTTSPLSKAVGTYKEVADSRGGSGFSFNDLAADRAGTRFGELALAQPRDLQARLAGPGAPDRADEAALMPPWRDLPEYLPEPEFVRRFGGVGAPEYNRLLSEIDRRIATLSLLR